MKIYTKKIPFTHAIMCLSCANENIPLMCKRKHTHTSRERHRGPNPLHPNPSCVCVCARACVRACVCGGGVGRVNGCVGAWVRAWVCPSIHFFQSTPPPRLQRSPSQSPHTSKLLPENYVEK